MPLYEYKCAECGEKFEALVSFKKADSGMECPCCGSEKTARQLSVFSASVSNGVSCASKSSCDVAAGGG